MNSKYDSISDYEINVRVLEFLYPNLVEFWKDLPTKDIVNGYDESGTHQITADYCNNPADMWPLIFENGICINAMAGGDFVLWYAHDKYHNELSDDNEIAYSANPLRAAAIVYLMMKEAEHERG